MFNKLIKKYPEIYFVLQFLLLFCVFYFGTEFWIGITSKGGYYNAFCEQYLNYIKWYRLLILNASVFFCNLFGYKSQVLNNTSVVGFNDFRVTMVYSCIGYGLLCFWAAFTVTYPTNYKRKLLWFALGFFILWIANVTRVSLLLVLVNKAKNVNTFQHHHTTFNIITYLIIIVLIYFFTNEKT